MDYSAERLKLVNWLKKQMIGPVMPGELQGISPLRRYPMGVLYPTVETGEGIDPATEDDDFAEDDYASGMESDSDHTAAGIVRRRYIPPSSVGFSFYMDGSDWSVQVLFSAAIYTEVRNDDGQFAGRYQRTGLGGDEDALLLTRQGRHFVLPSHSDGDEIHRAGIDVQARPHGSGQVITISMFNNQVMPGDVDPREWSREQLKYSLFEVKLACFIDTGTVGRYPRVDFGLLDEEEQELELQYKSRKIYAIGHGCAVDWREDGQGVLEIRSEFMPAVEVPQVTADVAGGDQVLNLGYLAGTEGNSEQVCMSLRRFVTGYGDWIKERTEDLNSLQADERRAGERITSRMKSALARMNSGIDLIERDAKVQRSFSLANQAMLEQMQQTGRNKGQGSDSVKFNWRPFQLAFLLTTLKSKVDPTVKTNSA